MFPLQQQDKVDYCKKKILILSGVVTCLHLRTLKMWSAPAVVMMCIFFGIILDVQRVSSQPISIHRKTTRTPGEVSKLEDDIHQVIDQIHSLSDRNSRSISVGSTRDGFNLNAYYELLNRLYGVFQPLLRERFIENLPKTLVCILSGREDCGLEAELTKTVSLELGKPLLTFLSSLRSQTCTPLSTDEETNSFFSAYLRTGESMTAAFNSFQQLFLNLMSSLSVSENLMNVAGGIMDGAVKYGLQFMAMLLELPMDYIRIALQFGIRVPNLDEQGTCGQGDLKQLILWGIKHNVSWSFGVPLIDIFLDIFLPPQESPFTHPEPECQNLPNVPFQRSSSETKNFTDSSYKIQCDRRELAVLNDTMCADILAVSGKGFSASVFTFCQALSSLNPDQMERMWSNMCYVVQALMSPLMSRSPDCSDEETQAFTAVTPLSQARPISHSAPHRVARDASNLKQLACNYNSWLESSAVDPVLVSLCSDNERVEFVRQVCNNALLMRKLLSDRMNSWMYGYCANSSADPGYMVSQFCVYQQWLQQPEVPLDHYLFEFCMNLDGPRLTQLICEHTGFLMILISNPDNWPLMPNCTSAPPPSPLHHEDTLQLESCRYSEWHDVVQVTTDLLSQCILFDQSGFTRDVCSNKTFLDSLLQNAENAWLEGHCDSSLQFAPTEPTPSFNIAGWCDYHTWGERQVDDSVVGLCWQHDQLAFQKNVCCKAPVFEKLLENPKNQWLTSVCTDIEDITVMPQVCKYSEWTRPIVVDMTELALCAEIDSLNFTSKVCANETVLQNLLTNQDNTWLIQHCFNHTSPGVSPGGSGGGGEGGGGGGLTGFDPVEQCQYSTWTIAPPDAALLTLCWEHDQSNFVSSICPNAPLLLFLSGEPSSAWVGSMCTTYTNYTTPNNGTTTDPVSCPAINLMKQLNWNCSSYFASACKPCATQNMAMQMIVRCWVENLRFRLEDLLTLPVARVLDQAVSTTVVVLLILEDVQSSTWHVSETIRESVLNSVVEFFKRETNTEKKRVLLQCFGTALTNLLLSTREANNDEFPLITAYVQEYFNIQLSNLRPVLSAAHISTVRLILRYYSRIMDTAQLSDEYLSTMVSVLLKTHLEADVNLFSELVPLLTAASPADIQALPSLQNNINVRETINENLGSMTFAQRQAFGLWYSKIFPPSEIARGHQSLIRDTGNLIAYLPFQNFQHLSAAQLLDGLDVLQRNTLTALKQEFIARSLIGTYRNLTAQDFARLGNIACLAEPEDLLLYKNTEAFSVIRDSVINCTHQGLRLPSHLLSNLLLNSTEFRTPSTLSTERLTELAPVLPALGVTFLQSLTTSQLLDVLPVLNSVSFSSAQASIIVDKLSSSGRLNPAQLQQLGSLIVGVKTEHLLSLTSDRLLSSLRAVAHHTPVLCPPHKQGLRPAQANAIATKLWGFPEVVNWNDMEPLLDCTPLLSVMPRIRVLVNNEKLSSTSTKAWNTQQAEAIFKEMLDKNPNLSKQDFLRLGTLGQGVSCKFLQKQFKDDPSPSSVRDFLAFLRQQPGLLHTSLKKCIIEELYKFEFFSELLEDFGAELALSMPVSTIKKFPTEMMDILRKMITEDSGHFLLLSRAKQQLLVDKIAQRMGMYTGVFTEEEFRSLGIMAPFVVDEVFIQVDRNFFIENLDFLKELCYSSSKMTIVARILEEPALFGPVKNWNQTTLSQVDRFLFFLPESKLQDISQALMTVGRIEKLFMSQRQWESGDVGIHCLNENEAEKIFEKKRFVLQFFLGFLKLRPNSPAPMVPTCEILHTTAPSAWTPSSLMNMPSSAFSSCLELMGQDPFLASYQRREVLRRVKEIYGPVSSFSQSLIFQLGVVVTEMSLEELGALRLTERRSIATMGAFSSWNSRQLPVLFSNVLNSTRQSPSQLDSSTLVAMGYIVCGATTAEIKSFNDVEFSKAVLWLGRLRLSCSEEQLMALVQLLTHSLAFGDMSSWGTDVFIEIGVLAAALPDMAMSALVKEQIEGISPLAISMIPPQKLAVTFDSTKISMLSYDQAVAVTDEQLTDLSSVQRTALALVLTPWEDRPVNFRGRLLGLAPSHGPGCLILGLLMLLTILLCHDT